ncbi:PadR family transcriptional regulator [Kitasatospora kifunensis]|uniref:DNA-binding PadR family transcriptional regulator n=1 Tax=Kitasatospora kifunensis TaxID=58351 RepID=A0A7W7RB71_KITKI|nr:PadR family transcriptional regulator [Kitasatospora kifunensis]MBB4928743.1 DNA-binding PadR family transcriptional regulator [Kitasatospora kifunensis]
MSLRHALLGLLADQPQTGYDLSKRFEESLSRYAWHAGHGHIYPELKKMAADDLIEVVGEGMRGSKTYGITERGTAELREWMFTPKDAPMRSESVLRLFLLSALDPKDTRTLVSEVIEHAEADAAALRQAIQSIEAAAQPGEKPPFARFAAEFGLRFQELQRDWAQWAIRELDKDATSTDS